MRTGGLVVGLLAILLLASAPQAFASGSSAPFSMQSVTWGTVAKPIEVGPGSTNVPLTLTIQYTGKAEASNVSATLFLAGAEIDKQVVGGFTDVFGNTTSTASAYSVNPNTSFTLTYYLDISNATKVGDYSIPTQFEWTEASSGPGYFAASSTVVVMMLGTPQLSFVAKQAALTPGTVNNITLIVSNVGSGDASQIFATISMGGASVLNPVLEVNSLDAGESAYRTISVYLPLSLSGSGLSLNVAATYNDPYGDQQSVSQTVGLYALTTSAPLLSFEAKQVAVEPGEDNTVPVTLTNEGSGPALNVHTQVTSSSQSSVLNQFPLVTSLEPGSSVSANLTVYVPQSLSGSPLTLSFSSSYAEEFGGTGTYSQSLGLYVANSTATPLPSALVSISPQKSEVGVGTQSEVSFVVKDAGLNALDSPVLSMSVSSPLVVIKNSSYAVPSGIIKPGESLVYEALVGASTSATPGYYSASVTVTYLNQAGSIQSASFSSGLVVPGTIDLIIQSPQVTQSGSTLTVSGELLNEGFSSAYYASATGSIAGTRSGSGQVDYIGEIDPNTPETFSVTVSYTPSGASRSANISVAVSYEDSLGLKGVSNFTVPATLEGISSSAGSTTSSSPSSSSGLLTYLEIGVVAALVVVGVIGFVYVRRNRASIPASEREEEAKEDKGVI